jgi:hypothetical protein
MYVIEMIGIFYMGRKEELSGMRFLFFGRRLKKYRGSMFGKTALRAVFIGGIFLGGWVFLLNFMRGIVIY